MPPLIRKRPSATENDLNKQSCSESKKKRISEDRTPRRNVQKKISDRHSSQSSSSSPSLAKSNVRIREPATPKSTTKQKVKKREKPLKEETPLSTKNVDDMNISQLLALGERSQQPQFANEHRCTDQSESDTDDDFEEVKYSQTRTPEIPREGVSVILQVPHMKRRNKMATDAENHIKRELNRVKKGIQLLMHKVHVLCWIAHIKYINNVLNSPVVMESCIVFVKSKNLYPSKYSDLNYLEGVLKWFHKNFKLESKELNIQCTGDIIKDLPYQIEKKTAYSSRDFTLMFIVFLRILGLKARIIMSFQVIPMRPSLSELLAYGKTDVADAGKEGTSKLPDNQAAKDEKQKCNRNLDLTEKDIKQKIKPSTNCDSDSDDDFRKKKPKLKKSNGGREKKGSNGDTTKVNVDGKSIKNVGKKISKSKGKKSKEGGNCDEDNAAEDDDFLSESLQKAEKKKPSKQSPSTSEESARQKEKSDLWTEVYLESEEKWISVDVPRQKVHCINELHSRTTRPVLYIIACNNDSTLKDVTKRYVPNWHSETKKKRVDDEWWNETMKPYLPPRTAQDREEDEEIAQQLQDKPLPSAISEFKDHPLYALKRHLLKFEAIYPPEAPTLGFIRGEPVYARECVHTLHSREMWYKQARVVRLKEEPYKIVKARPKYDKMTGEIKKDLPLELFGYWQTEEYIPPIAVDGKVPRNEYGNVDLFKPCMLPIGTVHLQIPALNKVARKLGIDCAPATVGFDFHSGGSHPVFDGFVVCQEFKEILLDTWNKEIDESAKKSEEKKEKRIYGNWKRLIRGLLIREKLKLKYSFGESQDTSQ
ncbi:hypothetical protein RUM43_006049 [Polyplax serrata]|uniref:Uncharacterized protein n=1 Tax=Polyplax serrata TaxID=468196 RepID=A0AAN8S3A5_POLSC